MQDDNAPAIVSDDVIVAPPSDRPKEVPQDVPSDKPDEDVESKEAEQAETEEVEEPRKKSSGYARLKARHQHTIAENEMLKRQLQQPHAIVKPEPKVEDFAGDYLAFEKASIAYVAEKAVNDAFERQRQQDLQVRQAERQREDINDFVERTNEIKDQFKDFDEKVEDLRSEIGSFTPSLRDLIQQSDRGEYIVYHLASNPEFASELNGLPPLEQAKQIGRIEERLSLPRKETKAPPPIHAPKGGAAPPRDHHALAAKSDDISDYVKARKAMKDL